MKLRRKRKFAAEVATSSLNDIMFFLLLFFLIISTVANPNVIKLLLPKAAASQQLSKKQVTLSVDANKQYFIDKQPVATESLEEELKTVMAGIDEPTIVVRFDKTLSVQDLVDVLQTGAKLNIKMVMATSK
ncbi:MULTISPECIES: ExbD/TolR family protein [Spirosomataceae]|uniref:Biopolymer transporter ExbD n=2 Tax=Spirosomataceae TaxID=2896860 RepID=A0ABX0QHK5_9BACT|nr:MULTISPECIES: biopolymer transporter ExbD [Spirosomataceae]ARK09954.1 biopolymer transporter ExbD [Fibrella sp. ES10-3-2-2]MBO0950566.1 biopolymer transporter ExbD [Fibrella forsythiae]NID11611.1 biopolymer transporter ExbD [Fibrivirga algicola]